jgi:CMP-N-acetylneuraminic acid synthetase
MTDLIALVPMKGSSERVPNKNMREFNGRPLCHWILNTLTTTSPIDRVVVNTDSETIASEARKFDVQVIDRPPQLQGDRVSMNDIILHDIEQTDGEQYLQTHCTNPLLKRQTIVNAIERFRETECDSLFSVTPIQTRLWDDNCIPINHERDELKRTQDLPPVYEENSNIYLFTREAIQRRENRIGDDPSMFSIERNEAIDIDEPIDFTLAESIHRDWYGAEPALDDVIE